MYRPLNKHKFLTSIEYSGPTYPYWHLKALKEKRIPNYWESEDGKRFLEVLSKTGGCAKAAAKLPPPEKQAKPSGMFLFFKFLHF